MITTDGFIVAFDENGLPESMMDCAALDTEARLLAYTLMASSDDREAARDTITALLNKYPDPFVSASVLATTLYTAVGLAEVTMDLLETAVPSFGARALLRSYADKAHRELGGQS